MTTKTMCIIVPTDVKDWLSSQPGSQGAVVTRLVQAAQAGALPRVYHTVIVPAPPATTDTVTVDEEYEVPAIDCLVCPMTGTDVCTGRDSCDYSDDYLCEVKK